MKLSEQLKQWRSERPDKLKMDEFIRKAEGIEKLCEEWFLNPIYHKYIGANGECPYCGATYDQDGRASHSASDCPYIKYLDIID